LKQQIRFCRAVDGTRIAYASTGAGTPLVKTANWLTHLEFDWSTPLWKPFLTRLSERRQLIRYDQRGNGLSDWEVDDLSFEACVRDLEAVVDAAGIEQFDLLGISQGGPVAIGYAARHPERVRRLVLYGAFARGMLLREPADERRAATSALNAERILTSFSRMDVRAIAPHVRCPTKVVHVRDDTAVPFDEGRLLATLIPDAEFVPLEGANHVLIPDDPAFAHVVDEIEKFLAGQPVHAQPATALPQDLTLREREVLELIAQGLDNAAIARALRLSSKTVRNHVTNIFSKLAVAHRPAAIVLAREAGFGRQRTGRSQDVESDYRGGLI
jgi:pimeloyl-ACP methyl ester carboxylesterase/DNA-binding CsgD family transcriptional regulator